MKTRDDDEKSFAEHMGIVPYAKFMTDLMNTVKEKVVAAGGHNRDLNEVLYDMFCHHTGKSVPNREELDALLSKLTPQIIRRIRRAFDANAYMHGQLDINELDLNDISLSGLEEINDKLKELINDLGIPEEMVSVVHVDADGKVISEGLATPKDEGARDEKIDPELEEKIRAGSGFNISQGSPDKH